MSGTDRAASESGPGAVPAVGTPSGTRPAAGDGRPRRRRRGALALYLLATGVVVITFLGGYALGALSVTHGSLLGVGTETSGRYIPWWTQSTTGRSTPPGALRTLSTTPGSPTVLGGTATNYELDTATGTDTGVLWTFSEATNATVNTELELQFSAIVSGTTYTYTVYIETQATIPGTAQTYEFFWDSGTTTTLVLQSWGQLSEQCPSVGTCP